MDKSKERKLIDPVVANLVAFLAVVLSIVVLALNAQNTVDLSIMTGLIGVLGSFKPWETLNRGKEKVEVEQPAGKPIPTTDADAAANTGELPESERIA